MRSVHLDFFILFMKVRITILSLRLDQGKRLTEMKEVKVLSVSIVFIKTIISEILDLCFIL